jgi:exodeoxyribonuclease VII large subunit
MNEENILETETLSVSALNRSAKLLLEDRFPVVHVTGEISNFSMPRSGHWYFTLKDSNAQVRCAMFRGANQYTKALPKEGDEVIVRAKLSLYENRGDYQLIVGQLSFSGLGRLQQAFEALKQKLETEGLFQSARKKKLPSFPKRIGVITSVTGAAIRDILTTIVRRYPAVNVYVVPTAVQGAHAQFEIVQAIERLCQTDTEVIIVGRGGGSIEDLWAFNEELVARAIAQCPIPIVSAVGHETDFTIADFVADIRAPTPTAAAELCTPDSEHWLQHLSVLENRLLNVMERLLEKYSLALEHAEARLIHPGERLQQQKSLCQSFLQRCYQAVNQQLSRQRLSLEGAAQLLNATSPLSTLARGYSVVHNKETGEVVSKTSELRSKQCVDIRLSDGTREAIIK